MGFATKKISIKKIIKKIINFVRVSFFKLYAYLMKCRFYSAYLMKCCFILLEVISSELSISSELTANEKLMGFNN